MVKPGAKSQREVSDVCAAAALTQTCSRLYRLLRVQCVGRLGEKESYSNRRNERSWI